MITIDDLRYPPLEPYRVGHMRVSGGHSIYFEECGNPKGDPILLLHGGPGAASGDNHRRYFDPSYFRYITFHQRGCGLSKPTLATNIKTAIRNNSPQHLVDDVERLRSYLKIKSWHVTGGSWGSTLALFYAIQCPSVVKSLTLSGIYLHRAEDIDWYINKMGNFFPEADTAFVDKMPRKFKNPNNRLPDLFDMIVNGNKTTRAKAAYLLGDYEGQCLKLEWKKPGAKISKKEKAAETLASMITGGLECVYMQNYPFVDDWFCSDTAKKALKKIKDILIVNGRHDVITPPAQAYILHRAHPHSKLQIIEMGAHSRNDIEMMAASINSYERLKSVNQK